MNQMKYSWSFKLHYIPYPIKSLVIHQRYPTIFLVYQRVPLYPKIQWFIITLASTSPHLCVSFAFLLCTPFRFSSAASAASSAFTNNSFRHNFVTHSSFTHTHTQHFHIRTHTHTRRFHTHTQIFHTQHGRTHTQLFHTHSVFTYSDSTQVSHNLHTTLSHKTLSQTTLSHTPLS